MTVVSVRILLQIFLVLYLTNDKSLKRVHARDHWLGPLFAGIDTRDYLFCTALLLLVVDKNHRTILSADVVPLLVECGGIVDAEKHTENFLVIDLLGIKRHLDTLGVPRASGFDV